MLRVNKLRERVGKLDTEVEGGLKILWSSLEKPDRSLPFLCDVDNQEFMCLPACLVRFLNTEGFIVHARLPLCHSLQACVGFLFVLMYRCEGIVYSSRIIYLPGRKVQKH